jgi:hypothetical protein
VTEHASDAVLDAYARLGLEEPAAWAVEVHLEACPACRSRLPVPAGLGTLLDAVQVKIDQGVRSGPAPARRRRRRHHWLAWSLIPWVAMVCTAVLAAFLLDRAFPHRPSVVLLLAPVAPLAGMAAAWSRRTDPAWELVAGTARAGLELLLRRTVAILATVLPPLAAAGWLLGRSPAQWLLPCLAFTAATLLLGGRIGVARAAAVLGGAWLLLVAGPAIVTAHMPALIQPGAVPGWTVAAVVVSALALLRAGDHRTIRGDHHG